MTVSLSLLVNLKIRTRVEMRLPSETASHHLIIVIFRSHSAVTTGISVVPSSNTDNTTCAKRGSTASQCTKLLTPRISFTDDTIGKVPRIYCISHKTKEVPQVIWISAPHFRSQCHTLHLLYSYLLFRFFFVFNKCFIFLIVHAYYLIQVEQLIVLSISRLRLLI